MLLRPWGRRERQGGRGGPVPLVRGRRFLQPPAALAADGPVWQERRRHGGGSEPPPLVRRLSECLRLRLEPPLVVLRGGRPAAAARRVASLSQQCLHGSAPLLLLPALLVQLHLLPLQLQQQQAPLSFRRHHHCRGQRGVVRGWPGVVPQPRLQALL